MNLNELLKHFQTKNGFRDCQLVGFSNSKINVNLSGVCPCDSDCEGQVKFSGHCGDCTERLEFSDSNICDECLGKKL